MKKLFLFLILISPALSYSQYLYPVYWGSVPALTDITFADDTLGFVVGAQGKILRTTDEGFNWDSLTPPVNKNFNSVYFLNTSVGFIAGSDGTILKTSDKGFTWQVIPSNTTRHLNQIVFFNSNVGIAVGDTGTIVKTIDGGINWSVQTSGTNLKLKCASFSSVDTIFVGSVNGLFKTYDGGSTWVQDATNFNTNSSPSTNNIKQITFTSSNTAFLLTDINYPFVISGSTIPKAYKTVNKGVSWQVINDGSPSFLITMDFINDNTGCISSTGSGSAVRVTNNAGTNWTSPPDFWPNWGYTPKYLYETYFALKLKQHNNYFYCITAYYTQDHGTPTYGQGSYFHYQISKSTNHYADKNLIFATSTKSRYVAI